MNLTLRPGRPDDAKACGAICYEAFKTISQAHNFPPDIPSPELATGFLTWMLSHPGFYTVATIIGFFGHAVGETSEELKALIGETKAIAGPGFLLPTRNTELFRWCLANGLRVTQPMTLMSLGLYNEPAGAFLPSITY